MDLLFFEGCCLHEAVFDVVVLQSADGIPDAVMSYGSINALYPATVCPVLEYPMTAFPVTDLQK